MASPHDATGGDQLDLVHTVLDLLAHGLHHGLGSVDALHQAGGRRAAGIMASAGAGRIRNKTAVALDTRD